MQALATDAPGLSRYAAMAAGLRARVAAGEWPPGAALPSEQVLASQQGVAHRDPAAGAGAAGFDRAWSNASTGRGTFVRASLGGAPMLRFFRFDARLRRRARLARGQPPQGRRAGRGRTGARHRTRRPLRCTSCACARSPASRACWRTSGCRCRCSRRSPRRHRPSGSRSSIPTVRAPLRRARATRRRTPSASARSPRRRPPHLAAACPDTRAPRRTHAPSMSRGAASKRAPPWATPTPSTTPSRSPDPFISRSTPDALSPCRGDRRTLPPLLAGAALGPSPSLPARRSRSPAAARSRWLCPTRPAAART